MQINQILLALSDATRRSIYVYLVDLPRPVGDVAEHVGFSMATVSRHLKVLRGAGLVRAESRGQQRWYRAVPGALLEMAAYVGNLLRRIEKQGAPDVALYRDYLADAAAVSPLDLDPEVFLVVFRMRQLVKYAEDSIGAAATQCGINRGQLFVLEALMRLGPPYTSTPSQLQAISWVSLAGIGKQLERLESIGYVQRRPNPNDSRATQVCLTEEGLDAVSRARDISLQSPHARALIEMGRENRGLLADLLRQFQLDVEERQS